ncbi:MFS transporter [SAR92 clade bacterium H231]|nr:MFS transporter [SAR92 clade bacterium H231]MDA7815219.1 MFS transporter [Porticoccaceae bacterium]MDA8782779.1 MFS transporter [Porticoccaceae bacterium]MDA8885501.1 MFS transporter [Porticoccaceae bacterium]MDA8902983.1 MFS transporter [Porticoccaceae bacterium]
MSEFTYGWKSLLAATIGTMCGIFTLTNYTQGFFVGPVTSEFGWSAPQFFLSYTVLMCSGLLTGPLIGYIAQRVGLRTVGIVGLIGHSLAYVVLSLNTGSLMLWYLSWALVAILGAGSLPIIWTGVLNNWFTKHRGKAIGITMAGTGLGAFLLPPIVEFLIANHGWRTAYRGIGLGALLISLPIVSALFKEKPDSSTATDGEVMANKVETWGLTTKDAMRTKQFWILGAVLFLTVIVVAGLLSNFERIMTEQGFERSSIAQIAAVMGLTVIIGRLMVGALVDRFWAPGVAACFFLVATLGLLILVGTQVTMATALLVAVMIGLAAGAELDLLAYLTGKYFGPAHYPAIFGLIIAFFTVGAGIAPPLFGMAAQMFQGYGTMLSISIGLLLVSILLFLSLGRYPDEE